MKIWQDVYVVLVEECVANPNKESEFLLQIEEYNRSQSDFHRFPFETRFMGALGFGGKFYRDNRDGRWYVSCYREDETPARRAMIDSANTRLDVLRQKYIDSM